MPDLSTKRIAIMATDNFEEAELIYPRDQLLAAGATVEVLAPHAGSIQGLKHIKPGQQVAVDKTIQEADPADYDGLVVPGGALNADHLRMDEAARNFLVQIMDEYAKPTAIICHGPWMLVSTGLARGKEMTSYFTIQDDLRNAGAIWLDEAVVEDENLITSRKPDDLPAFTKAFVKLLAQKSKPRIM